MNTRTSTNWAMEFESKHFEAASEALCEAHKHRLFYFFFIFMVFPYETIRFWRIKQTATNYNRPRIFCSCHFSVLTLFVDGVGVGVVYWLYAACMIQLI